MIARETPVAHMPPWGRAVRTKTRQGRELLSIAKFAFAAIVLMGMSHRNTATIAGSRCRSPPTAVRAGRRRAKEWNGVLAAASRHDDQ
jgi:hypothetical protein